MADEENPFGGGPFGVGPFGPLVAVAVAAATTINAGASVTTSVPRTKTLHYQAKVFVAVPDEVLNPPTPSAESFTVTTGQNFRRTLFYQANIAPPAYIPPTAEVVVSIGWHAPFSAPPPRQLVVQQRQYQPFVPALAPPVTPAQWLQPFKRQVAGPFPVHTQPVFGFAAAPQPTPDEWLQPFQKAVPTPPARHTQPLLGYQPEVVVSNLTTTLEWLQPFQKAVAPPHPALSQPVFGYPYEAQVVSNLTTTLEWQIAWQGSKPTKPVHTQPVFGYPYTQPNLTTTLEWQIAWQASKPTKPIHTQPVLGTPPEQPVTPDKWQIAWQGAKPSRPVHTQPALGSPYFLPNLTSTLEWQIAWQGAKPTRPIHTQPVFGYPYFAGPNLTTTLEWQIAWQKAVPARPPTATQPFYGYPYVSAPPPPNLTTTLEWLQQWKGPPRYWPIKVQQTPFIPKEFVQDQITPDRWLQAFQRAAPRRPIHTQPVLGRSDAARLDVAWLQPWPRAVAARPVTSVNLPWNYAPVVVADNTVTIDKWQQRFTAAVQPQRVTPSQPVIGYSPPEVVAADAINAGVNVGWSFTGTRTLFYQAWAYAYPPPPEVVVPPAEAINAGVNVTWSFTGVKTLFYQAWAFAFAPPAEVIVPPEPPVPGITPKHSHGQITSVTARTTIGPTGGSGVCVPAFEEEAFQADAFQTCVALDDTAIISRGRVRTAGRIHTSSRWKRSRTTIRTSGKARTRPKDDP